MFHLVPLTRNQVLNDALTRLTSSEPYPGDVGTAGNLSAMSTASAGRDGSGFPEIPRLTDRGRELAASLGGEHTSLSSWVLLLLLLPVHQYIQRITGPTLDPPARLLFCGRLYVLQKAGRRHLRPLSLRHLVDLPKTPS